jgi:hypothetical protein
MLRYYPSVNDPTAAWKNQINQQASLDSMNSAVNKLITETKQQHQSDRKLSEQLMQSHNAFTSRMTSDVRSSIDNCASLICGSLNNGFDILSSQVNEIGRILVFGFTGIYDQLVLNNIISENIALLLRIPDSQKERQHNIEQGFKHLKNAFIDPDLYDYALKHLLKAEQYDDSDYIVLHQLGKIYLNSPKHMNLQRAEKYFRKAGKFAVVESHPDAHRIANILTGNVKTQLSQNFTVADRMRRVAAESFFQGAISCYIQKNYIGAAELATKAFDLAPEMLDAGYYACQCYALIEKQDRSLSMLERVVNKNLNYIILIATDPVLTTKPFIKEWLIRKRNDTVEKGLGVVKVIKSEMVKNSKFSEELITQEESLKKADLFTALDIYDFLRNRIPYAEENSLFEENRKELELLKRIIELNNAFYENAIEKFIKMPIGECNKILSECFASNSDQWSIRDKTKDLIKKCKSIYVTNIKYIRDSKILVEDLANKKVKDRKERKRSVSYTISNYGSNGIALSFLLGLIGCSVGCYTNKIISYDQLMVHYKSTITFIIYGIAFSVFLMIIAKIYEATFIEKTSEILKLEKSYSYLSNKLEKYNDLGSLIDKLS